MVTLDTNLYFLLLLFPGISKGQNVIIWNFKTPEVVLKSEYLNFMVAERMYEYIKGYSEIPDTMKRF